MTAPLHELVSSYAAALERCDPDTGEVPEDVGAVLDALADALPLKIEALAGVRARYLADAAACKALSAQYAAKAARHAAGAERIEAYVLGCLESAGIPSVKGATASARVKESASVVVTCKPEELEARFQRHKPATVEPDKIALKAALDLGEIIANVILETRKSVVFR